MAKNAKNAVLTDFKKHLVLEYMSNGFNKSKAYRALGGKSRHPSKAASDIFGEPVVKAYLRKQQEKFVAEKDELKRRIVARLAEQALGDANDLVEHRRVCCRYCHGEDHRYQHTAGEWEVKYEKYMNVCYQAELAGVTMPPDLDVLGGLEFKRNGEPHPDCPECQGEGISQTHFKDSTEANALYAGVKRTKEGLEIQTHDQHKAMDKLGKHLGLFEAHEKAGAGEIHIHLDDKDARA